MKSNNEIAKLLVKNRALKKEITEVTKELILVAYDLGLPQSILNKIHVNDFLDGYLAGQGVFRKFEEEV